MANSIKIPKGKVIPNPKDGPDIVLPDLPGPAPKDPPHCGNEPRPLDPPEAEKPVIPRPVKNIKKQG